MQKTKHLLPLHCVRAAGKSGTVGDSVGRGGSMHSMCVHIAAYRPFCHKSHCCDLRLLSPGFHQSAALTFDIVYVILSGR